MAANLTIRLERGVLRGEKTNAGKVQGSKRVVAAGPRRSKQKRLGGGKKIWQGRGELEPGKLLR